MKNLFLSIILTFMACTGIATAAVFDDDFEGYADTASLLANGAFYRNQPSIDTLSLSLDQGVGGSQAMQLDYSSGDNYTLIIFFNADWSTADLTSYGEISLTIKGVATNTGTVTISVEDRSYASVYSQQIASNTETWTDIVIPVEASWASNAKRLRIGINGSGTLYIDNLAHTTVEALVIPATINVFEKASLLNAEIPLTLSKAPSEETVVTLTPDENLNLGAGAGVAVDYDFNALNWDQPQMLTISSADTADANNHVLTATIIPTSASPNFVGNDINVKIWAHKFVVDSFDSDRYLYYYDLEAGWANGSATCEHTLDLDLVNFYSGNQSALWQLSDNDDTTMVLMHTVLSQYIVPQDLYDSIRLMYRGDAANTNGENVSLKLQARTGVTVLNEASVVGIDNPTWQDILVPIVDRSNIANNYVLWCYSGGTPTKVWIDELTCLVDFVLINTATGLSLVEGGHPDYFDVSLLVQPTNDVVVTMTATNEFMFTDGNSVKSITFTPANYQQKQQISIIAADNSINDMLREGKISFNVTSLDDQYDGISVNDQIVSVSDNGVYAKGCKIQNDFSQYSSSAELNSEFMVYTDSTGATISLSADQGVGGSKALQFDYTNSGYNQLYVFWGPGWAGIDLRDYDYISFAVKGAAPQVLEFYVQDDGNIDGVWGTLYYDYYELVGTNWTVYKVPVGSTAAGTNADWSDARNLLIKINASGAGTFYVDNVMFLKGGNQNIEDYESYADVTEMLDVIKNSMGYYLPDDTHSSIDLSVDQGINSSQACKFTYGGGTAGYYQIYVMFRADWSPIDYTAFENIQLSFRGVVDAVQVQVFEEGYTSTMFDQIYTATTDPDAWNLVNIPVDGSAAWAQAKAIVVSVFDYDNSGDVFYLDNIFASYPNPTGNFDGSGLVNLVDFAVLSSSWDNQFNMGDLLDLVENWLK